MPSELPTPKNVIVTQDPAELPPYPLNPPVRSPLKRTGQGLRFVILQQPTKSGKDKVYTIPDALGSGGDTQIGESRKSRVMPPGQTANPPEAPNDKCDFDKPPEGVDRKMLEVDNIKPFGPMVHKLVYSRRHIEKLREIKPDDLPDAVAQFYEIAENGCCTFGAVFDGLAVGMNFGEYLRSGASQRHLHYQVAGISPATYNPGDRLGALCQAYRSVHPGEDYLSDYEEALVAANLVVGRASNGRAFAFAPISPRFKGEVQIMLTRREGQNGHILDTTPQEREALGELQYILLRRLDWLGCVALNQLWYMTRFSTANTFGQRLIVSICPRTSIMAQYELLGYSVIDMMPWEAAATLRAAESLYFGLRP